MVSAEGSPFVEKELATVIEDMEMQLSLSPFVSQPSYQFVVSLPVVFTVYIHVYIYIYTCILFRHLNLSTMAIRAFLQKTH